MSLTEEDLADLQKWEQLYAESVKLRNEELDLRKKLVERFFKEPQEGVNKIELPGGKLLVMTYSFTRTVDEAFLTACSETFREHGINLDEVIRRKPELSVAAWRRLTPAQRKLFDNTLVIKPSCPSMEIKATRR